MQLDSIYVVSATSPQELERHRKEWDALAEAAIEPNVFLEPWQLLPALEVLDPAGSNLFLLVFRASRPPENTPLLIGMFAFSAQRGLRGIPVRWLSHWQHPHLCLGTPLIHRQHAREAWKAMFEWLKAQGPASLIEFRLLAAEGPSHHALTDTLRQRGLVTFEVDRYTRATLRRADRVTDMQSEACTGSMRKEWRRQRKRLAERGRLELRQLQHGEDVGSWLEAFLRLEASGWKGRSGTALGRIASHDAYFRRVCTAAAELGRLHMLGLFLDDVPVAMKCSFLSGETAFTLKIAYDEAYRAYSPGVLLELDFISAIHSQGRVQLVDSCAIPDHPMINRLWQDRREIVDLLISPASLMGNLTIAFLALSRCVKRCVAA